MSNTPPPPLLQARLLLFAKQHGVVAALCLCMLYQIGILSQIQSTVCGV